MAKASHAEAAEHYEKGNHTEAEKHSTEAHGHSKSAHGATTKAHGKTAEHTAKK